jgi:hypothetical protein
VPAIVEVANQLAGRADTADRKVPSAFNGAYFIPYNKTEKHKLQSAYQNMLDSAAIRYADAVILCRSGDWVEDWRGGEETQGQGAIRSFINAVICRDKLKRYQDSFQHTCVGLIGVLADAHGDLWNQISRNDVHINARQLKRAIWTLHEIPGLGCLRGHWSLTWNGIRFC